MASYWLQSLVEAMRCGAHVQPKESSRFMRLLGWLLWPINRDFMSSYTTTIGKTIYMPEDLVGTDQGADVVYHEIVHVQQYRRWGILFQVGYLCLLPTVITLRAYWEFEAYKISMYRYYDRHGVLPDWYLEVLGAEFTGPAYLWMCPFPGYVRRKLSRFRDEIYADG